MKYRTFSRLASANDAPGGAQENSPMNAEATDGPTRNRFKRMEAAWRALAEEQDWLDGAESPVAK